jgi:hypothetical protein
VRLLPDNHNVPGTAGKVVRKLFFQAAKFLARDSFQVRVQLAELLLAECMCHGVLCPATHRPVP